MGGISLASGIASSIASSVESRKASEEIKKKAGLIADQAVEDETWFNKQYYQDLTKRTEVQNMLRLLDENQRKADSRSEALAAITGATPEQQLASREINRKTYADAVANIASNASNLRDQYLRDYQGQRNRYYAQRLGMQDQLAAINANAAAQWANAAGNAFLGGAQMMAAGEYGGSSKAGKVAKTGNVTGVKGTNPAEPVAQAVQQLNTDINARLLAQNANQQAQNIIGVQDLSLLPNNRTIKAWD